MRRWWILLSVVLFLAALTAACTQEQPSPTQTPQAEPGETGGGMAMQGDPKRGEELFNQTVLGQNPGCVTCHSLEPDVTLVGPSMAGIATRAAERVPGMSAEEYLKQSLLEPDAYLVEGFAAGSMPSFEGQLSDQDLADIIAFLMTLK